MQLWLVGLFQKYEATTPLPSMLCIRLNQQGHDFEVVLRVQLLI